MKMKKTMAVVLALTFVVSVLAAPAFAAQQKTREGIVDVGNKMCPVSGDPVSGKDFVTYKGKRYGLCCPMCEAKFLSSPEQYVSKMVVKKTT